MATIPSWWMPNQTANRSPLNFAPSRTTSLSWNPNQGRTQSTTFSAPKGKSLGTLGSATPAFWEQWAKVLDFDKRPRTDIYAELEKEAANYMGGATREAMTPPAWFLQGLKAAPTGTNPIPSNWMEQLQKQGFALPNSPTQTTKVAAGITLPSWWNNRNALLRKT